MLITKNIFLEKFNNNCVKYLDVFLWSVKQQHKWAASWKQNLAISLKQQNISCRFELLLHMRVAKLLFILILI